MTDSHSNNTDSENPEQLTLDEVSTDTWKAYEAMFETKRRHYEFLELLENKKKKFNIQPSEKDKSTLAEHLAQHDEQVKTFTRLSIELKKEHPDSHKRLFEFIAQLGDGDPGKSTPH